VDDDASGEQAPALVHATDVQQEVQAAGEVGGDGDDEHDMQEDEDEEDGEEGEEDYEDAEQVGDREARCRDQNLLQKEQGL
jgi:hypothetical protein